VVFTVGDTVTEAPLRDPGIQEYVEAPEADRVLEVPMQMEAGNALAEILALGLIVTLTVAVPEHPATLPVTVYVVLVVGETLTGEPVKLPGIQV